LHFVAQSFSWIDIPIVFLILIIEILLASDNAAALAMIVKKLPADKKEKALFAGLVSASFFRAIGVIFTAYLIYLFWMQIIGGLYLIYLAWHYLFGSKKEVAALSPTSYWKAVLYIEIVDVLFAIDSILGAFALAALYYPLEYLPSKLWVIYLGGILGVVAVRCVTGKFLALINKHKKIELVAFLVIGWMGVKLFADGSLFFIVDSTLRHILDIFFWIGTLCIVLIGIFSSKLKKT
jgi:YkoY family integral membrane protein